MAAAGSRLDFGPNALMPTSKRAAVTAFAASRPAQLRAHVRVHCPRKPGVYAMLDRQEEIIYVGKAKNLRSRLLSYFRVRSREPKAGRILARTRLIAWEISSSEFAALHRELELIQRWRPRFNVVGQPRWRNYAWLCLGRFPAPYVYLANRLRGQLLASFGPIPAGRRAREAIRRLNNLFGLRDCPQSQELFFGDQGELFPLERRPGCLRFELKTCLGPCVGACTRSLYDERVRGTQNFLNGSDTSILGRLEQEMKTAAAEHRFERAGVLRDNLAAITWLHAKLEQMRRLRAEGSFVYPVAGHQQEHWYLIHGGQTIACVPAPKDAASCRAAAERITEIYEKGAGSTIVADYAKFESVLLVDAWFRKYPEERQRRLSPVQAVEICRGAGGSPVITV